MALKVTLITSYTQSFTKTDLTGQTFNNGMNKLKDVQIYIFIISNMRKNPHRFTN